MCLIEVFVSIGMAAVVPHVDGRHLGDVQGAVVPKVLQHDGEMKGAHLGRENVGKEHKMRREDGDEERGACEGGAVVSNRGQERATGSERGMKVA